MVELTGEQNLICPRRLGATTKEWERETPFPVYREQK